MKIAIIGAGNLGLAIAKGVLHSNGATTMYLTKRNVSEVKDFEKYGNVTVTSDNREAVEKSDTLIFAVQPGHFTSILD
ncbi:MAG: NAD(P)-binding domain-containing protein, partial [Flavobacteriaceae bacterium]